MTFFTQKISKNTCNQLIYSSQYYPFGVLLDERSGNGGYRYGFQGSERDDEVKGSGNSYTTHFRQLDPRVGRWLSVDPMMAKFTHQSPYVDFDNNPIYFVDPLGAETEGHWYGEDGTYLGDDGKDDDNVYVATSYYGTQNQTGRNDNLAKLYRHIYDRSSEQYENSDKTELDLRMFKNGAGKKLDISQSDFLYFSGVVKAEESGTWEASNAIAGAILNNQEQASKEGISRSVRETIKKISTVSNKKSLSATDNSMGSLNARRGTLQALLGIDYSNGATHWDGFDFAARGPAHPKGINQGFEISIEHYNQFKAAWSNEKIKAYSGGKYTSFSTKLRPGIVVATGYNNGRVLYQSSAIHGSTIFWKPNRSATENKGYQWKYYFK